MQPNWTLGARGDDAAEQPLPPEPPATGGSPRNHHELRRSDYTVAAMIADGFTHLEGTCSKCGSIVLNPFRMMLNAGRITGETTLGRISAAYVCKKCGGRQAKSGVLQPAYQYMGTPADSDAESPVNRRRSEA